MNHLIAQASGITTQDLQEFGKNVTPFDANLFGTTNPIAQVIWNVVASLFIIAVYAFLLAMVIGSVQYLYSLGNEEALTKAKKTFLNALIGLVIVFVAYNALNILIQQFGPDIQSGNIAGLIAKFYEVILIVSGGAFLLLLLFGGFRYMTAAGNEDTVAKAKAQMVSALIGMVLLSFAFTLGIVILKLMRIPIRL